jgi:hypothetical protein
MRRARELGLQPEKARDLILMGSNTDARARSELGGQRRSIGALQKRSQLPDAHEHESTPLCLVANQRWRAAPSHASIGL